MTPELTALAVAVMLGLTHIVAAAYAVNTERGYHWKMSERQKPTSPTGVAGRLSRASKDYMESFALFVAAVFVVHATQAASPGTALAAGVFVVARGVYLFACASGIMVLCAPAWGAASVAIVVLLLAPVVPYW